MTHPGRSILILSYPHFRAVGWASHCIGLYAEYSKCKLLKVCVNTETSPRVIENKVNLCNILLLEMRATRGIPLRTVVRTVRDIAQEEKAHRDVQTTRKPDLLGRFREMLNC